MNMNNNASFLTNNSNNQMNTVYVGDLDDGINEEMIKQHFSQCGQVSQVKLLKSHYGNTSRGFGFVTYADQQESEAAIKKLNMSCIIDNRIRVCKYKTSIDKSANLFIKNITKDMNVEQLINLFKQFGPIFSLKIARNIEGEQLSYGYVQFESVEAQKKCLEHQDSLQVMGQQLVATEFVRSTERKQHRNNIYLKNLPIMSEEDIKQLLLKESNKYGKVSSIMTKIDSKTKKPFAFVCFEEYESATKAFEEFQNLSLDKEQKLYVSWSQKKQMRTQKLLQEFRSQQYRTNLFMKNLNESVDQTQLQEVFSKHGTLTSVAIKEPTSVPSHIQTKTKYAFVNYSNHEEAKRVLDKLKMLKDCDDIIALFHNNQHSVCFFKTKEQMKKQKEKEQNSKNKYNQNTVQMMQNIMQNPMMVMFSNMMMSMGNMNNRAPQQQRMPMQNQQMMRGMNMMPGATPLPNNPRFNPTMMPQQFMQMPFIPQMQQQVNMSYMQQPPIMQQQPQVMQQVQQVQPNIPASTKIQPQTLRSNLAEFLKLDQEKQRAQLGELLFPLVNKYCEDKAQAPKVTGMLIDFEVFEVSEILEFLENEELLNERIQEAEELIVKSG